MRISVLLGLALLMAIAGVCGATTEYRVTPLAPVSGYTDSVASDVNDHGVAVGISSSGTPGDNGVPSRACVWDSQGVRALDPLPGYNNSGAQAINNSGVIVGYSTNNASTSGRACYWDSTGVHDLGASFATGIWSAAEDINEQGHILVSTFSTFGSWPGYIWNGTALNVVSGAGWEARSTYALSNNGVVVGEADSSTGPGPITAGYWDINGFHALPLLQTDQQTGAYDINDLGIVVGMSYKNWPGPACLWDGDGVHDLGSLTGDLGAFALGINNSGLVVGSSIGLGRSRPVFWDATGPNALPLLPALRSGDALALNENGLIVGRCKSDTYPNHMIACLWTPVPEPSALLALASGLGGVVMLRRRRKTD